jgi:hypothetical protein
MLEVLRVRPGLTVLATDHEVRTARLLLNGLARAALNLGEDDGSPLPGVDPMVEAYVRRIREKN